MKNKHLERILEDLGLTENESRIYLTSLSLGPSSILNIARSAEIRRTTVYTIIDALKKKGLIYIEPRGFKKVYVAEHPSKLTATLENKKRDFEKHMPEFLGLYNLQGKESTIKYYEGLESVKSIYNTILDPMKPKDDYLVISDLQKFVDMDEKYFKKFLDKRIKSKVKARLIATDSEQARYMKKYSQQMNHEMRILPKKSELSVDIMITPQKVSIFNLEDPLSGIGIENLTTIRAYKQMFEIMWHALPE
jgi:sugar-specific transcriptional regulator TrmB